MTAQLRSYEIVARSTGLSLGAYEGATPADALEVFARAAGYASRADQARQMGRDVEELDAELLVEDVTARWHRAAAIANGILVDVGVTTADRPVVWIREDGAAMIQSVGSRPATFNVEAMRALAQRLVEEHGEDSDVGLGAQDLWSVIVRARRGTWSPATGQDIAGVAYHLGVSLEQLRRI